MRALASTTTGSVDNSSDGDASTQRATAMAARPGIRLSSGTAASEASASAARGAAARDDRAHKLVLVDPCDADRASGSDAIRVLIACGDRLVRAGLNALLNLEADMVVVGAAADGQQAVDLARQLRPEVLLIDTGSRAVDGVEVARRLTADANTPGIHVLMLSGSGHDDEVFASLRAGASGFLLHDAEPAELVHGVRAVAGGEAVLSARVARQVIADSIGNYVRAVLYNGLGRYDDALAAARQATEYREDLAFFNWGLVELIEAAVRSGKPELAADALGQLSPTTSASGTDWALGVEARSRALLTEGGAAETLYRQAIETLGRTRVRVELARAHLLYGEWLRRERRRLDAREQLRHAHQLFTEFGMEAFAERARVELEATGEHARKRTVETLYDLTPQEAQISRLAADGATNQQIAAQLFISPSTVDYHLRKAFRKLGVKSRHELKQHLLQPRAYTDPAARELTLKHGGRPCSPRRGGRM
jgi:DNA-binding NarL/FixJ family response regulator